MRWVWETHCADGQAESQEGPVTCPRAPCGWSSAGTQPHWTPHPMRIHRPRQLEAGEDVAARWEGASAVRLGGARRAEEMGAISV